MLNVLIHANTNRFESLGSIVGSGAGRCGDEEVIE